jgi:hypothetical protein
MTASGRLFICLPDSIEVFAVTGDGAESLYRHRRQPLLDYIISYGRISEGGSSPVVTLYWANALAVECS